MAIDEYIQVFFPSQVSEATLSFWLDEANYLLELSLCNYMISCQPSSLIAVLALKIALQQCILPPHITDWTPSVNDHVHGLVETWIERRRENLDHIMEICWILQRLRDQSVIDTQALDRFPNRGRIHEHVHVPTIPFLDCEIDRRCIQSQKNRLHNLDSDATLIPMDCEGEDERD